MMNFHEEAFKATAKIAAAVAEEAEVELTAEGAKQIGDFFSALYRQLNGIACGDETQTNPGTFEVYQDAKGEYRFRLKAANGETIAASEGYKSKAGCLKGIDSVKRHVSAATIKEL